MNDAGIIIKRSNLAAEEEGWPIEVALPNDHRNISVEEAIHLVVKLQEVIGEVREAGKVRASMQERKLNQHSIMKVKHTLPNGTSTIERWELIDNLGSTVAYISPFSGGVSIEREHFTPDTASDIAEFIEFSKKEANK